MEQKQLSFPPQEKLDALGDAVQEILEAQKAQKEQELMDGWIEVNPGSDDESDDESGPVTDGVQTIQEIVKLAQGANEMAVVVVDKGIQAKEQALLIYKEIQGSGGFLACVMKLAPNLTPSSDSDEKN